MLVVPVVLLTLDTCDVHVRFNMAALIIASNIVSHGQGGPAPGSTIMLAQ